MGAVRKGTKAGKTAPPTDAARTSQGVGKAMGKGEVSAFYLIHGPDRVVHEEVIQALKKALVRPGLEALDFQVFDGREVTSSSLMPAVMTPSFSGGRRLILIKGGEVGAGTKRSAGDADGAGGAGGLVEACLAFLSTPHASACVVVSLGEVLPDSHPLVKAAGGRGEVIAATDMKRGELIAWVREYARGRGKQVGEAAAARLVDSCEAERMALRNELDKAIAFAGGKPEVGIDDIEAVVVKSHEESVFDLLDAVIARRGADALSLLRDLLAQGEEPLGIISLLARQVQLAARAGRLAAKGHTPAEIASVLKVKPFVAQKALNQSRSLTRGWVAQAFEVLLEADLAIKSGSQPPDLALELLIARLVRPPVQTFFGPCSTRG